MFDFYRCCHVTVGLELELFGLTDPHSFQNILDSADLVISHAGTYICFASILVFLPKLRPFNYVRDSFSNVDPGAGSILETLRRGKKLLTVVNERLQENHQVELASALAAGSSSTGAASSEAGHKSGFLFWCTCTNLCETLRLADFGTLAKFPEADLDAFPRALDAAMGFSV
jgi:UDP-N-acetylglucosamine transferase subunit ALG13